MTDLSFKINYLMRTYNKKQSDQREALVGAALPPTDSTYGHGGGEQKSVTNRSTHKDKSNSEYKKFTITTKEVNKKKTTGLADKKRKRIASRLTETPNQTRAPREFDRPKAATRLPKVSDSLKDHEQSKITDQDQREACERMPSASVSVVSNSHSAGRDGPKQTSVTVEPSLNTPPVSLSLSMQQRVAINRRITRMNNKVPKTTSDTNKLRKNRVSGEARDGHKSLKSETKNGSVSDDVRDGTAAGRFKSNSAGHEQQPIKTVKMPARTPQIVREPKRVDEIIPIKEDTSNIICDLNEESKCITNDSVVAPLTDEINDVSLIKTDESPIDDDSPIKAGFDPIIPVVGLEEVQPKNETVIDSKVTKNIVVANQGRYSHSSMRNKQSNTQIHASRELERRNAATKHKLTTPSQHIYNGPRKNKDREIVVKHIFIPRIKQINGCYTVNELVEKINYINENKIYDYRIFVGKDKDLLRYNAAINEKIPLCGIKHEGDTTQYNIGVLIFKS